MSVSNHNNLGEQGGLVIESLTVESLTPKQEVGGLIPT